MAINRADVVKAKFFKHRRGDNHALGMFFQAFCQLQYRRRQHRLTDILGLGVELPRHQTRQITIERAHRWRNRHVVVVKNHQEIDVFADTGIIHGLKRHASGHRAVANDCNGVTVFTLGLGR